MDGQQQHAANWPPTDEPAAPVKRGWPPADWPSLGQLSYTKELITVLLLLLALPWLVSKLLTRPGDVLSGLGRRQVGKAAQ
jgi:hypothetical protein